MSQINAHAAGIDIGAHDILACVPDGDDQQLVRAFGTYTADLDALADWCVDCGIQCCLISAQAIKHVPGRKSDVLDCQWIQTLHSSGV